MSEASPAGPEWALDWRSLDPEQRGRWWERLWTAATELDDRYRLGLRSGWWRDDIQVQTLAAFAAWVKAYDSGAWTDPAGKLQLLYDLDRVRVLLRGGESLFEPDRELPHFTCEIAANLERLDQGSGV